MPAISFPLLRGEQGVPDFPLAGRLVTVGQSKECSLNLVGKGIPDRAGHLLFRGGEYQAQAAAPASGFKVNGKTATEPVPLRHGDALEIGPHRFRYLEKPDATQEAPKNSTAASWNEIAEALALLLRDRDSDDFAALVSGVSRLFRCDAARMVEEDSQTGERRTVARFPVQSGLERFSNRAIDWAKASEGAVLTQEADWEVENPAQSLRTNSVSSVLCAALREQDRILGYLYLDRLRGAAPFTESDRELCDSLRPLFSEILERRGEMRRQRETIARLQSAGEAKGGMIYASRVMGEMLELAAKAARTSVTVLITGETGTGKELLAKYLHEQSPRTGKPFLALNCGAIPENLMESELFGHEKGAFTGADQRRIGLFQSAHQGTLLLDEIGELAPNLQVKLLRVLQEGEVTPVGGTQPMKIDVRVLAATNRDLALDVREGRFRQDLYFRLSVLKLALPPLRNREQDTLLLADYLVRKYATQFGLPSKSLSQAAKNRLLAYAFPGNIRELENSIQKALLMSEGVQISAEDLSWEGDVFLPGSSASFTLKAVRQEAEKKAIASSLAKAGGNVSLAAKILDVDRKWLMKLMEEAGLKADDFRGKGES